MIAILCHQHASGQIGCPEIRMSGRLVPSRQYTIIDHMVEIAGDEDVVSHDVATLIALGFTLASPRQQEDFARARRGITTIAEKESENTQTVDRRSSRGRPPK